MIDGIGKNFYRNLREIEKSFFYRTGYLYEFSFLQLLFPTEPTFV